MLQIFFSQFCDDLTKLGKNQLLLYILSRKAIFMMRN
jgi:hypothetical protein